MKRNLTCGAWGLVAGIGVVLFTAGCERSITPVIGGETHWLEPCDSDAECGTDLSCACGICTVDCTSNASCNAVEEGGRCVSRADADFADDCASTAPAQVCAPIESAGGAGGGGSGGNGGAAPNEIRGARYDVDGDCFGRNEVAGTLTVPAGNSLACDDVLTYAFEADGTCWLFNDSCIPDDFIAQGDPRMGPALFTCTQTMDSCPGVEPGSCSDGLVSSDGECLSCEEARARNYAALDELALDETLLSCQVDTDCGVLSTDTLCGGTCGKVAALATRDKFEEGVAEVSAQFCSEPNWNDICGFSTPDCELAVFSCQENRCVYGVQPACVAQGGCDSPLECFAETCAQPCTDSAQCGAEERCVKEEAPGCLLAVVDPSATDSGRCLARCQTDEDCGGDAPSCWAGYCVGELPACEAACPKIADSCGGACDEVSGRGYHPDDVCRDAEPVVLGCVPTGRVSTDDDTCVVSPEGVVYSGLSGSHSGQLVRNGGYVTCTEAETNAASESQTVCPSTGAPRAALNIEIGGAGCEFSGTGGDLPEGQSLAGDSAAEAPERIAAEACTVAPDGDGGFDVSARINTGSVVFSVSTVTNVTTSAGEVDISYQGPGLSRTGVQSAAPCSARAIEYKAEGGAIFLELSCSALEDAETTGSTCSTTNARVILENCEN